MSKELADASSELVDKVKAAGEELRAVEEEFIARHSGFKKKLDEELAKLESGASLNLDPPI